MRITLRNSFRTALIACACLSLMPPHTRAQTIEWVAQLGGGSHEDAIAVSADGLGNVYIAGETNSGLGGGSAGGSDAFIAKFDSAGKLAWKNARGVPIAHQIGTSGGDHGFGVSADGLGNVYMSGSTEGNLAGANAGGTDAFITKWDTVGNLLWTRQFGTAANDISYGVSADRFGNVYTSGISGADAFVSKYDASGNLLWTRQPSSDSSGGSYGVSADGLGNVFISGAYGTVSFVSKYDSAGNLQWTQHTDMASPFNSAGRAVSADGLGNVYITGSVFGSQSVDTFLSKYDSSGALLWTRVYGGPFTDESFGVSADGLGNVYISGRTNGPLGGLNNIGIEDAFVIKYDAAGNLIWSNLLGTTSYEGSLAISTDHLGNVFPAGGTEGSWGTANRGFGDSFVVKINDAAVPEPATGALFVLAGIPLVCRRRVGRS